MRPAFFLAAALALAALPAAASAAPDEAATTTDLRCLMVAGALSQSENPDLKSIGSLSLFYFWGRLEGRGAPKDIAERLIAVARSMTGDQMRVQAQTCAEMSKAAGLGISGVSDALSKALGSPPTPAPAPSPPPGK